FNAWDKSSGITVTESQISDLTHFTNADAVAAVEPLLTTVIQEVKEENEQLRNALALLTDRVIALEAKHKKKKKRPGDDGGSDDKKKKEKKDKKRKKKK
ncbi:MAG: hypothetical protein H8D23_38985, partial [Candidatus Brocadiales bacterium]|nr:hypothetical protein [Candidatus Brocadiales bacterium]